MICCSVYLLALMSVILKKDGLTLAELGMAGRGKG